MYLYIGGLVIVILIIIIYFIFNRSSESSACIYDHNTTKSFIVVADKSVIRDIQDSINKNDGNYYIDGDKLYHNNKIIKRLVPCTKDNMILMNKKYGTDIVY